MTTTSAAAESLSQTNREFTPAEYRATLQSQEYKSLKSTIRSFVFPMSAAFLLWYLFYVVLATYFPDLMGRPAFGGMNVGVVLGLAQFVTSFLITWAYVRFANSKIEPQAAAIREKMEG